METLYNIPANTLFIGKPLIYLPSCHSTNETAQAYKEEQAYQEGCLIITSEQLAGRGQMGNSWESEPFKNLTFSVLLKPLFLDLKEQYYLNIVTSLSVYEIFRAELGKNVRIKWPNDIYYHQLKLSGILIQNSLKGTRLESSVVGIGMNINQAEFQTAGAASLHSVKGLSYSLNEVLNSFCSVFESYYLRLKNGERKSLREEYEARLFWRDEERLFTAGNITFKGVIRGVEEDGRLRVETEEGFKYFNFKEIVYKKELN